jgi:hypothetical protein
MISHAPPTHGKSQRYVGTGVNIRTSEDANNVATGALSSSAGKACPQEIHDLVTKMCLELADQLREGTCLKSPLPDICSSERSHAARTCSSRFLSSDCSIKGRDKRASSE